MIFHQLYIFPPSLSLFPSPSLFLFKIYISTTELHHMRLLLQHMHTHRSTHMYTHKHGTLNAVPARCMHALYIIIGNLYPQTREVCASVEYNYRITSEIYNLNFPLYHKKIPQNVGTRSGKYFVHFFWIWLPDSPI